MRSCKVCPIDCASHAEYFVPCPQQDGRGMPGMGRLLAVRGRRPVLVLHWQQHTPEDSAAQPPRSLSTPPDGAVPVSHVRCIPRVIHLIGFSTLLGAACTGLLARVPTDALRGQCSFKKRIVNAPVMRPAWLQQCRRGLCPPQFPEPQGLSPVLACPQVCCSASMESNLTGLWLKKLLHLQSDKALHSAPAH